MTALRVNESSGSLGSLQIADGFGSFLSGSIIAGPNITISDNGSGSFEITASAEAGSTIGNAEDGSYADGLFTDFAADTLIGLSKYTRLAQWCARRGTLQEELAMDICKEIQRATGSEDVGVYIQATHGCCENRGIMATSSLTQTTVLRGSFFKDGATKKEFMDNIKLQQSFVCK